MRVEIGGVYMARTLGASVKVQVRRISRDGRWADVVPDFNGVWCAHGWRTLAAKLFPID